MDFVLITLGMVGVVVAVLVLLARAYPGSGADLVDWKPTRDYETEIQLEQDDIAQMIAAQNEYRRKRGDQELTAAQAEEMARQDNAVRQRGRSFGDLEEMADVERAAREVRTKAEPTD